VAIGSPLSSFATPAPQHVAPGSWVSSDHPALGAPLRNPDPQVAGTADTVVGNVTLIGRASQPIFDAATGDLYVANGFNFTVVNASTDQVVTNVSIDGGANVPCLDPLTGDLYLTIGGVGEDEIVSTLNNTVTGKIPTNQFGTTAAFDPANGDVYIPSPNYSSGSGELTVYNGSSRSLVTTIALPSYTGSTPSTPMYDPQNGELFVALASPYFASNWVVIIEGSTNTVFTTLNVGQLPTTPVFNPANGDVYFGQTLNNSIGVIDGRHDALLTRVPVSGVPGTPAVDAASGEVYIPVWGGGGSQNMTVVLNSTNAVVGTIPTGSDPGTPTIDPADDEVYIPSQVSSNIIAASIGTNQVASNISVSDAGIATFVSTDNELFVPSGSMNLTSIYAGPFEARVLIAPNPVDIGLVMSVLTVFEGGRGVLSFGYSGLPDGCLSANLSTFNCVPSASGTFSVGVSVTDGLGDSVAASTTVVIHADPNVTLSATPGVVVDLSRSIRLTTVVTNGTPPYNYSYAGFFAGCPASNASQLECTPTGVGSANVTVTVRDGLGFTAGALLRLAVTSDPTITGIRVTPSTSRVDQAIVITPTLSGGAPPYEWVYLGLPAGCISQDSMTLSCTPTGAGSYNVSVSLVDADGWTANASTTIEIQSAPSASTLPSSSILLIVGVGVAAAAAGVVYWLRVRSRKPSRPR
jgi:DNA-binding beta-propeller fold protein YncE